MRKAAKDLAGGITARVLVGSELQMSSLRPQPPTERGMVNAEKDQFDALMKLAEFKRAIRDQRRQFGWKFTATALVAPADLAMFPKDINNCVAIPAVVLVCVVHTLWVYCNMLSNERDRSDMYYYKNLAEKLLSKEMAIKDIKRRPKGPLYLFQQPTCLFPILTAYGVGCFSIVVRILAMLHANQGQ